MEGYDPAGILCAAVPRYARHPPIEAAVFAWGVSEDRQLGLDTEENVMKPKVVESLLGRQFRGREFGRTPLIAGSRNTLAIDAEGQLWSWGWNDRGTLGHGHRGPETKPKPIAALRGIKIVQAALGGWHCLALSENGQVYAWGGNEYQQCGVDPDKRDIVAPVQCVPFLRVVQVSCGGMHSLALTDTGDVWTWGEPWGDFALNVQRAPRRVEGAADIAAIAAGAFHNLALTRTGQVYSWGTNDYGQLGDGSTSYRTAPNMIADLEGVEVADIAAGGWHSLALSVQGEVYCWGRGEYGRLGIGDRSGSSKLRPVRVKGLEGHKIVQASAGGTHTMALTSSGQMFIWGRASFGRLGLPPEALKDCYSPVECALPGGHDRWRVVGVTAGGRHSMCLAVPVRESMLAELEEDECLEQRFDYEVLRISASTNGDAEEEATTNGNTAAPAPAADARSPSVCGSARSPRHPHHHHLLRPPSALQPRPASPSTLASTAGWRQPGSTTGSRPSSAATTPAAPAAAPEVDTHETVLGRLTEHSQADTMPSTDGAGLDEEELADTQAALDDAAMMQDPHEMILSAGGDSVKVPHLNVYTSAHQ